MNIDKYLQNISLIDSKIANKVYELEMWKEIAEGSGTGDGERVQASSNQQKMADAVIRYADIEKEIETLRAEKRLFVERIERLPRNYYLLLHDVYIKGLTLKESERMNQKKTSWGSTTHARAKKELMRVIENERG